MFSRGRIVVSLAPFASWPRPIHNRLLKTLRDDHALMHVEGPAVVTGQVVHVRRVGDDERIQAGRRHSRLGLRQALGEFLDAEGRVVLPEFHVAPS